MLRSQTNSRITRYLHFCGLSPENFDKHIRIKFPMPLYYSRAQKGSTNHVLVFLLGGEALSKAEPPAGPLRFKMLQFSNNGSEIPAQSAISKMYGFRQASEQFSSESIMTPDLSLSHSPREKFSWTSRLHHPKRHAFFLILEASRRNP